MDDVWERSIPLYSISSNELSDIFREYDTKLTVLDCKPVNIGCRNSNYIVTTNSGLFLLRIVPADDKGYINEKVVSEGLKGLLRIPILHFVSEISGRTCLIYEYIESISMQNLFTSKLPLESDIIRQVANSAAVIHNVCEESIPGLVKLELPPYASWYEFFLDNKNAVLRLGLDIVKRVKRLVKDNENNLREIDRYQSVIHGDFRPANMLVSNNGEVFIVDWEFTAIGHTLADLGQFFRYRNCFTNEQLSIFEVEYNKHAKIHLPAEWQALSRLRDLVNPLQMIGAACDLPLKYQDLKDIVLDTLECFGY